MGRAVQLRQDYDGDILRRLARASNDSDETRRLLALALIYDGGRRGDAAQLGGVTLQIIRDWVQRFNAEEPEGLKNRWAGGAPLKLKPEHKRFLAEMIERGPISAIHGVVRWRCRDLAQELYEDFGVSVDESAVGKKLREMGCRKISVRGSVMTRTNTSSTILKKLPPRAGENPSKASRRRRDRTVVAG